MEFAQQAEIPQRASVSRLVMMKATSFTKHIGFSKLSIGVLTGGR